MKHFDLARGVLGAGIVLALAVASLYGCARGGDADKDASSPIGTIETAEPGGTDAAVAEGDSVKLAVEKGPGYVDVIGADDAFSARDLDWSYDSVTASIVLAGSSAEIQGSGAAADGSTITIFAEGTYVISGTLADGQIVVDAADTDKVQLVLDGVSITSSSSAAIYVKSADKVFVTLKDGTVSSLATTGAFIAIDENNIDGTIFAKDDLTINGTGTLEVSSTGHGIVCKDDLTIVAATVDVSASGHAIQANDSLGIAEAALSLSAGSDGIHAADDEDVEEGWVYIASGTVSISAASDGIDASAEVQIDGGTIAISAGDDGVHAEYDLVQNGGDVTISKSYEAYEAATITVTGGTADMVASADGLNATGISSGSSGGWGAGGGMEYNSTAQITITGGTIYVDASGDGIDSNGDFTMAGGAVYVSGPTDDGNGALDYAGSGTITGGTVVAVGSAGMPQSLTAAGSQGVIMVNVTGDSGSTIAIEDADGTVLASYAPTKSFGNIVISAPGIERGGTYILHVGSTSVEITMDSLNYGGMGGMGMMGGPGPGMGGRP